MIFTFDIVAVVNRFFCALSEAWDSLMEDLKIGSRLFRLSDRLGDRRIYIGDSSDRLATALFELFIPLTVGSYILWITIFWVWIYGCQFEEWWRFVQLMTWRFYPLAAFTVPLLSFGTYRSAKRRFRLFDIYNVGIKSAQWEMTNRIVSNWHGYEVNLISITYLIVDYFSLS